MSGGDARISYVPARVILPVMAAVLHPALHLTGFLNLPAQEAHTLPVWSLFLVEPLQAVLRPHPDSALRDRSEQGVEDPVWSWGPPHPARSDPVWSWGPTQVGCI